MKNFSVGLFLRLSMGFVVACIVGTLSHEAGHWLVAECYGIDAQIHHSRTTFTFHPVLSRQATVRCAITLGGPLQTMLTGSIGLALLFACKKQFAGKTALRFWQWCLIFLALFWMRQPVNMLTGTIGRIRRGYWAIKSDESKLDWYLLLPQPTINIITSLLALLVLPIVFFRFIPKQQRPTFLLAGLFGGAAGYSFWLHIAGPVILP